MHIEPFEGGVLASVDGAPQVEIFGTWTPGQRLLGLTIGGRQRTVQVRREGRRWLLTTRGASHKVQVLDPHVAALSVHMIEKAPPGPIETKWGLGFHNYDECMAYIRAKGMTAPEGGVVLPLPYSVFEDQRSGETLGKLQKVRSDVEKLIAASINVLFTSLVGIVFVMIYAFSVHWVIAPVYFLTVPLLGLLSSVLSRRIKQIQKVIVAETTALAGSTTESLRNI